MIMLPREREREVSASFFLFYRTRRRSLLLLLFVVIVFTCVVKFVERKGEVFSSSSSFANYIQMSLLLL